MPAEPTYTFHDFRRDALARVRRLNAFLQDPKAVWPGVLILDQPDGLAAERRDIPAGDRERKQLAEFELPALVRDRLARRFCWVMPATHTAGEKRSECLLLLIGERGRCEAIYAHIVRDNATAPQLGPWHTGAYGRSSRTVTGQFVTPLLRALEPD
jgi:hypothetical protein